jgi:tetratricopeptide (TPR) repeat protein
MMRHFGHVGAVLLLISLGACAARTPPAPPLPATLRYPDFVYPVVPEGLRSVPTVQRIDSGWRFLQNGDLRSATREFAVVLKRTPRLYPAEAGAAYVALADRDPNEALRRFDGVLSQSPSYVPALVGKGQALLAMQRENDALLVFQAALAVDPSLVDVRRRVDVLRFRGLQDLIERARASAASNRLDEARLDYYAALAASPDSAFLHRELALVERRRGDTEAAMTEFRRASELDASDAASLVQIGEILEQRLDLAGAEAAYRKAAAIEPAPELTRRIAGMVEKAREAKLPSEFRAIPTASQITRGELAALIGVRLEGLLDQVKAQQVVMTDVRNHWAAAWIARVAAAGVLEPYANHTFQPRTGMRRVDLATAVSRLLTLVAARNPELRAKWADAKPNIADVGAGHLSYPAVSLVVASGVMPLLDNDRFAVGQAVTGAEAVDVIGRVLTLARRPS